MGLCSITRDVLRAFLPARILALGYPDGIESLDMQGSELTVIDLVPHRGDEVLRDLSSPVDLGLGQFDVVLDHGTVEHVANPAQAFLHVAAAVRLGGVAIHATPSTMVNHGWWNVSPSWFGAFYDERNGFEIERIELLAREYAGPWYDHTVRPWPRPVGEPMPLPVDSLTLCVARRIRMVEPTLPLCEGKWYRPHPWLQTARRAKSAILRAIAKP